MSFASQSVLFFLTILGGVFAPLLFFVVVKYAVDFLFDQLEKHGFWRTIGVPDQEDENGEGDDAAAAAAPAALPADAAVRVVRIVPGVQGLDEEHVRHHNVLVDGVVVDGDALRESGALTATGFAVEELMEDAEPEPPLLRLRRCVVAQEPVREGSYRGANHRATVEHGDQFEVLSELYDSREILRLEVRLVKCGTTGWIRADSASSGLEGGDPSPVAGKRPRARSRVPTYELMERMEGAALEHLERRADAGSVAHMLRTVTSGDMEDGEGEGGSPVAGRPRQRSDGSDGRRDRMISGGSDGSQNQNRNRMVSGGSDGKGRPRMLSGGSDGTASSDGRPRIPTFELLDIMERDLRGGEAVPTELPRERQHLRRSTASAGSVLAMLAERPREVSEEAEAGLAKADALGAVRGYLVAQGWSGAGVAAGACDALDDAGVPPAEWLSELEGLLADGQLAGWVGMIEALAADASAPSPALAAPPAAEGGGLAPLPHGLPVRAAAAAMAPLPPLPEASVTAPLPTCLAPAAAAPAAAVAAPLPVLLAPAAAAAALPAFLLQQHAAPLPAFLKMPVTLEAHEDDV